MTKKKKPTKWPEHLKNEVRLKYLFVLPAFQEDLFRVRKELNIPADGFATTEDYERWDMKMMDRQESVNLVYRTLRLLGEKYKLPGHFYMDLHQGLFPYISLNKIVPPVNNWVIEPQSEQRPGMVRSLSIKTYAPLSKREIAHASKDLARRQKYFFPMEITLTTRAKEKVERDLEIFLAFLSRSKMPVRRKQYRKGSYLHFASKNHSKKELVRLERMHKSGIYIDFDEETSRNIAKRFKIKPDAARKAAQRVAERMADFFGPDNKSSR